MFLRLPNNCFPHGEILNLSQILERRRINIIHIQYIQDKMEYIIIGECIICMFKTYILSVNITVNFDVFFTFIIHPSIPMYYS